MPLRLTSLLLAGACLLVSGCGNDSSTAANPECPQDASAPGHKVKAPAAADLVKAGTLTVGSDVSYQYPPQEYYPAPMSSPPPGCGGKAAVGFDIDIAKALAAHMGLKFALVDMKFADLVPALQSRKIDVAISAMTITDERKQVVQLEPYLVTGGSFVVLASSKKNPKEIKDLCGLRVAVEKGSVSEADVTEANDPSAGGPCAKNPINFKETDFDTDLLALDALRKGKADVHFTDSSVAAYELMKNSSLKISSTKLLNAGPEGIATRTGAPGLSSAVTAAFKAMSDDGTYRALLRKWNLAAGDIKKSA